MSAAALLRSPPHTLLASLCAGVALANGIRGVPSLLAVAAAATALAAACVQGHARLALAAVALLAAGLWWGSARLDALDRSVLARDVGRTGRARVVVTGPVRHGLFALRVPARTRRFAGRRLDEAVLLELPLGREPPQGAILDLVARPKLPRPKARGFDERAYLRRRGVHVVVAGRDWRVVGRRGGLGGVADRLRAWLSRGSALGLRGERAGIVRGVVLGDEAGLSPALVEAFRASGLLHLLAVEEQARTTDRETEMKLDAYIRVSKTAGRSGDSYHTIDIQAADIQSYAERHGHEILETFIDSDQSGRKYERKGLQAALERVESGESQGIIVWKLDRFSRSVSGASKALERLEAARGHLVSVGDDFDTTSSNGRFQLNLFIALAQMESDRIGERLDRMRQRVVLENGVHIASRAPTGYRREVGSGRPLELSEHASDVAEVFRRRAEGESWTSLAKFLTERGVVGPYGNPRWTPGAVQKLVRNPVYLGEARHGELRKLDAHPALVSRAVWLKAQQARAASQPRSGDGALLSGLVRCAGCRYVLKADKMTLPSGERVRIYRCRGVHAAGECEAKPTVMGRVIEPYVTQAFFEKLGPQGLAAQSSTEAPDLDGAEQRVTEARADLQWWLTEARGQTARNESYLTRLTALEAELSEAEAEHARLLAGSGAGLADLALLADEWPTLTTTDRRELLTAVLDAVIVRNVGRANVPIEQRSILLWRGEATGLDLPRRGHRVPLRPFDWPDDAPGQLGLPAA